MVPLEERHGWNGERECKPLLAMDPRTDQEAVGPKPLCNTSNLHAKRSDDMT